MDKFSAKTAIDYTKTDFLCSNKITNRVLIMTDSALVDVKAGAYIEIPKIYEPFSHQSIDPPYYPTR